MTHFRLRRAARSSLTACLAALSAACGSPPPAQTPQAEPAPAAPPALSPAPAATASPSTAAATPASDASSSSAKPVECDLVCERAQVVQGSADGSADRIASAEGANRVLTALQPSLLGCYKKRIAARPDAHAFMNIDILVGPDGVVKEVATTGGALLGQPTIDCLVGHIKAAKFDPPKGGGTMRLQIPFSLRRVGPGDET